VGRLTRFALAALAGGVGLACCLLLLVPAAAPLAAVASFGPPPPVLLHPLQLPSKVYDRSGHLIAVLQDADYRTPVPLSEVPPQVVHAVLDVEDRTFFSHGPIDVLAILRALHADLVSGRILEGGSTITQQLVKESLLTPRRTLGRKLEEVVLAYRLEHVMTKRQILARYLNTVYFGHGAYGIEAAARTYFGVDVRELTVPDAALLAGLIENPTLYDPIAHPQAALERRNVALEQMVRAGDLTPRQAAAFSRAPLPTTVHPPATPQRSAFVETVVQQLLADPRLGPTPAARYHELFEGGLRITTTLSSRMQAEAEAAVSEEMPDTGGRFAAALVAVDPRNGEVRALVPGNDVASGFDVVTGYGGTGRQPGSSFKLFTIVAALESGYSPYDTVDGTAPCTITLPGAAPYVAHNAEPGAGVVNLVTATANSINCAFLRLGVRVGLGKIIHVARQLGIRTPLQPYPSMIIGSEAVTPLEMAAAYATMADDGVYHPPVFVTRVVTPSGRVLIGGPPRGRRVVPAQVVAEADLMLQAVVNQGTGTAAALPGRPVAGKTGTTDHFTDAWFDGYTPQLATVVWVGAPSGSVPMYDVGGITVYGATYPARIWHAFMAEALAGRPVRSFPEPDLAAIPPGQYLTTPYAPPSAAPPATVTPAPTTSTTAASPRRGAAPGTTSSSLPSGTSAPGPTTTLGASSSTTSTPTTSGTAPGRPSASTTTTPPSTSQPGTGGPSPGGTTTTGAAGARRGG
jgi:membrane peptidoglycan carboxypeptidase